MTSNNVTLSLTPLQTECLLTIIAMYGDKYYTKIQLIGGEEGRLANVLQSIANQLPDNTRYYKIIGKHTGKVIGMTTSIADVLEEEPGSSFVEVTHEEWNAE